MHIGILKTGNINTKIAQKYGAYPSMFEQLFAKIGADFTFSNYAVLDNEFPSSIHDCDGWIITGSKHGVYDDLPWMTRLKEFIVKAFDAKVPMFGVCFGHQIMAEAMGGKVVKSDKGWGLGVHGYSLDLPDWAQAGDKRNLSLHAFHQDQVVQKPAQAHCIASSDFCHYAAFVYGDRDKPTLMSVQPHPEFTCEFEQDLLSVMAECCISKDVIDNAMKSLGNQTDSLAFARWVVGFFHNARQMA